MLGLSNSYNDTYYYMTKSAISNNNIFRKVISSEFQNFYREK